MFIGLYCCLLVRVQPLSLAWADLHHTDSLWALFQGPIVEFWLGYPIFYLGTSEIFPPTIVNSRKMFQLPYCTVFTTIIFAIVFPTVSLWYVQGSQQDTFVQEWPNLCTSQPKVCFSQASPESPTLESRAVVQLEQSSPKHKKGPPQ